MMHVNIRSIINKIDLVNNYSLNKSFHVIYRLNETNEELFKLPNYDFVIEIITTEGKNRLTMARMYLLRSRLIMYKTPCFLYPAGN